MVYLVIEDFEYDLPDRTTLSDEIGKISLPFECQKSDFAFCNVSRPIPTPKWDSKENLETKRQLLMRE